ncbi:MAG: hypothetical protein ABJL55_17875 [Roseibium sp.]
MDTWMTIWTKRIVQVLATYAVLLVSVGIGWAQQNVTYPENFDAKFVSSRHYTSNSSDPHITRPADLSYWGFNNDCHWIHFRGDVFQHNCTNYKIHSLEGAGATGQAGTFRASGTIKDGVFSGSFVSTQKSWDQGRPYMDDGLSSRNRATGSIKGIMNADGTVKVTLAFTSDETESAQQVQDEKTGHLHKTGIWQPVQTNAGESLKSISIFKFNPSLIQRTDPAITAETIQQELDKPATIPFDDEIQIAETDAQVTAEAPVSLSGVDGTIALEDALKSQAIGGEETVADEGASPPIDAFDTWKQDHLARGWRYSEENGIAEFKPQEGARDDRGWIYSEATGDFVAPEKNELDQIASTESDENLDDPKQPRDGDENANGDVWSDEDGGWIGRNLYDQEKERREYIKSVNERPNEEDKDITELKQRIREGKLEGEILSSRLGYVETQKDLLDSVLEQQISEETDPDRMSFLRDLQDRVDQVDIEDKSGALDELSKITLNQIRDTYQPDYSMKQFLAETGAMTLDAFLTKGAATASLYSYQASENALQQGASAGEALWEGAKTGVVIGGINYVGGKAFGAIGNKLGGSADDAATGVVGASDDVAVAGGKTAGKAAGKAKVTGNWNSSSEGIREEVNKKLLAKLPANHPARAIGKINEGLAKAGRQFDPRKINPHMRLDPRSAEYKLGIDALTKNPRYLTDKAKLVTDAVRHDLDLTAREEAVKALYKARPDLKGHLTHFENTGSHAMKGSNYRLGASDIDFTPKGTATAQGKEAEKLFSRYYEKAVVKVSDGKLTTESLKAHAYGGDQGTGAFRSDLGLKTKDIMNQTTGRIDKLDPSGKITHSLRGSDPLEVGQPTRFFEQGSSQQIAKADVNAFRKDLLNKFKEELPEMGTQDEKLIQAAKGYKLSRIIEAKAPGGRSLSSERGLYDLSKQIKGQVGQLTVGQKEALIQKFLDGVKGDI